MCVCGGVLDAAPVPVTVIQILLLRILCASWPVPTYAGSSDLCGHLVVWLGMGDAGWPYTPAWQLVHFQPSQEGCPTGLGLFM